MPLAVCGDFANLSLSGGISRLQGGEAQESSWALVPTAVPGQARGQTPEGQQGSTAAAAHALQTPVGSLVLAEKGPWSEAWGPRRVAVDRVWPAPQSLCA